MLAQASRTGNWAVPLAEAATGLITAGETAWRAVGQSPLLSSTCQRPEQRLWPGGV